MTEKNALRLITTAYLLLLAMAISNACAHLTQPGFLLPSATVARGADIALNVLLLPLVAIASCAASASVMAVGGMPSCASRSRAIST